MNESWWQYRRILDGVKSACVLVKKNRYLTEVAFTCDCEGCNAPFERMGFVRVLRIDIETAHGEDLGASDDLRAVLLHVGNDELSERIEQVREGVHPVISFQTQVHHVA